MIRMFDEKYGRVKQFKRTVLSVITAVIIFGSAPSVAVAAGASPDITLRAVFDGGTLYLSPKNVTFSSQGNVNPGDTYISDLLFENKTNETVEFSLQDVLNMLSGNEESRLILDALIAEITIGENKIFTGRFSHMVGLSSAWFSVGSGKNLPIQITYYMSPESDNRYQGLAFQLNFQFRVKRTVSVDETPSQTGILLPNSTSKTATTSLDPSSTKNLHNNPQTGDYFNQFLYIGIGLSMVLILILLIKKRDER